MPRPAVIVMTHGAVEPSSLKADVVRGAFVRRDHEVKVTAQVSHRAPPSFVSSDIVRAMRSVRVRRTLVMSCSSR
jgi:hypothetical protein